MPNYNDNKNRKALELVFKSHKDWIQICKVYGGGNYSEDIVQEMYFRLLDKPKYLKNAVTEEGVQKGYIFFMLRTALINFQNKESRSPIDVILDTFHYIPEEESELKEKQALEEIYNKIDVCSSSWSWYNKTIFNLYKDTEVSIRGLSKLTAISHVSIFHTLKECKRKIKKELEKDYKDYLEGNY